MNRMISFLTVALAVMAPTGLNAQDNSKIEQNTQGVVAEAGPYSLIMNPDAREGYSLDGTWNYLVDPYETGYYSYRMTPNNDAATFLRTSHSIRIKRILLNMILIRLRHFAFLETGTRRMTSCTIMRERSGIAANSIIGRFPGSVFSSILRRHETSAERPRDFLQGHFHS